MSELNEHLELLMQGVSKSVRERIKAAYWLGAIDCMKDCSFKPFKKGQVGNVIYLAQLKKDAPEGN